MSQKDEQSKSVNHPIRHKHITQAHIPSKQPSHQSSLISLPNTIYDKANFVNIPTLKLKGHNPHNTKFLQRTIAHSPKPIIPIHTFQPTHTTHSTSIQRARADGNAATSTARAAADAITAWLKIHGPSDDNYSVGIATDGDYTTDGDLIISKVNGTAGTSDMMQDLYDEIVAQGYHNGRDIFVAQKFNTAVGSNHAEMCIMAAAGQGCISYINCTGPHCAFCAAMMKTDNVTLGQSTGDHHQQGWTHPYARLTYGSQISHDTASQLAELKTLDVQPTTNNIKYGHILLSGPKSNKMKRWV